MPYRIIHDDELGVAVLIDPAGPHALGPAIGGEAADRILEAFVDGLDQDPTELTAFELAAMWAQYLAVLGYTPETDPTAAPAGAGEVTVASEVPAAQVAEPAPQEAGEGTAVLEAGRDEPPPEQEPRQFDPCPNCQSTKREIEPSGAIVCAVCGMTLDLT